MDGRESKIDSYFRQFTDKISFIQIKDQAKDYRILLPGFHYPIYTQGMIEGIKDGSLKDNFTAHYIIDGIISLLAIDFSFKDRDHYLQLIEYSIPKAEDYILQKALDFEVSSDSRAILYYRFLYLTSKNIGAIYSYSKLLYSKYLENEDKEKLYYFRDEAIRLLEEAINIEEENPLPYYGLGNIYTEEANYNKAYLFYRKALELSPNEEVENEIREKISLVQPNSELEQGIDALNRRNYQEAYERFEHSLNLENSAIANYYMGKLHSVTRNSEKALGFYSNALDLEAGFKEVYQDLSIEYYKVGELEKALEVSNMGLEIFPNEQFLLYNRMVIYINLGELALGKKDMYTLMEYGDLALEILEGIREIQNIIPEMKE